MLSVRSILARHLRASSNKIIYTGDQLWYSVRGGALNASAGGFGGDSILRERIDFWEDTIYGHGGDAKIWAGLTHDHDKFKDDEVGELGPVQRTLPLRAGNEAESEEAVETDEGAELEEKIMEFKRWCREYMESRTNVGYKADETAGRYIPTIFPADALNQFGRTFDDFRCCILDIRRVSSMAPKVGRLYRMRTTVVVGNGKGIYGIGTVQSEEYMDAIVAARKYAFENLQSAPMFEERTVPSDGYYQHNATHCLIRRQPEGFGIKANPILRRICDVIGYKDIHVKTRGSRTPMSLINCFARCLNEPETDQERADINGYNVVEIDPQRGCRPTRIAEPRTGKRTSPYPLDAHFFKQKIQKDLFNSAYSGLYRRSASKIYSRGRVGKTGHSYTGLAEYRHRPDHQPYRSIPDTYMPEMVKMTKDPTNFSRTRLNVPGLGGM